MNYILKAKNEANRLDKQTGMDEFSLETEISSLKFKKGAKILDAGCGSGVACRFLERKFKDVKISGCDLDERSLEHAKLHTLRPSTRFYLHDIVNSPLTEKYDYIFNRYVSHHLGKGRMKKALLNFHQALKNKGKICIVDLDGLFLNIGSCSTALLQDIQKVKIAFSGDLYIGRILPCLLQETGFTNINWTIQTVDFKDQGKHQEVEQWRSRFQSALPFYVTIFGNQNKAKKFFEKYTSEALKSHVPLFYNKFIITAEKMS